MHAREPHPARGGRPPDVPARRDPAPEPGQLPDADRHQGQPDRDGRRRPAGGRLRLPARTRSRRRRPRGPGGVHRRLRGDRDGRGGVSLRRADQRDDGTQLHPLVPDRRRGLRRVHAPPSHALDAPDRHPRHARRSARRRGGVAPDRHRAPGRADRLGRPGAPDRRGARRARRRRARGDPDLLLGRPRRVPDRRPARGRRPHRRLRRRHGAHDVQRRTGAGRRLQARRVGRARSDEGPRPEVEPARPPPGVPRRGRRRDRPRRRGPPGPPAARARPRRRRPRRHRRRGSTRRATWPPGRSAALPEGVRALRDPDTLPPRLSARLRALEEDLR